MRFVSFSAEGRASFGIARADGVFDLGARFAHAPDLKSYLRQVALGAAEEWPKRSATDYANGQFTYAPVISNPDKILCVGVNYDEHRKETGRAESAYPTIFTRFADTLVAHQAPIRLPPVSSALDYEGELAVVIGKPGFRVPEGDAMSIVAGYTCFNDATLRDWQRHSHQFTPGKNFPGTGALGPDLVTIEEIPLERLVTCSIETRLNGEVMQSALLGDMIFSIPKVIAYVSTFTRLAPGDIIATGTPGGVGARRDPPVFMKSNDEVDVTIESIGCLRNPIAPEEP
jgi:2-keto-4-pentenoate hydratase/2-oxohepta-3-ene-1,7-dioic acid hydratase in catechol pathway